MTDIVDRLRWWGAKNKAPKGMDTLPADCREAADEIERLRSYLKDDFDPDPPRRAYVDTLKGEIERLRAERQRTADIIEEAKRVLEPFANEANNWSSGKSDSCDVSGVNFTTINLGSFRAARALLSKLGER